MPISLSLDFVGDSAAVNDWRAMLIGASFASKNIFLDFLHIEAVFVADFLVQRGGRRAIA